jgi:D-aminopeptidase
MENLITDVAGITVGHAQDPVAATGVTVLVFDAPAVTSCAALGGAPHSAFAPLLPAALLPPQHAVSATILNLTAPGSRFGAASNRIVSL